MPAKLRQIEVLAAGGKSILQVCKQAGITDVLPPAQGARAGRSRVHLRSGSFGR